ncbi:unnamed protein product, partial [Rotaria sp. Silwood2]
SGAGVFAGYLGRDDLTRQVLIELDEDRGLCYRTGDYGRLNVTTEQLECVGRRDNQVKLRGQRIELGEIEACILSSDTSISNCVVIKVVHASSDYLVACVQRQSDNNDEHLLALLRSHCESHLASFMVPSLFTLLDRLPLTSSGKVDRCQLPMPDFSSLLRNNTMNCICMPCSNAERTIACMWTEILYLNDNNDEIDTHTSFFVLGGNSMKLMKLYYQYSVHFKIDLVSLPIARLFYTATIAEHAKLIEQVDVQKSQVSEWKPLHLSSDA